MTTFLLIEALINSSITDHYPVFIAILNGSPNTKNDADPFTTKIRLIDDSKIRKFKSALKISFS